MSLLIFIICKAEKSKNTNIQYSALLQKLYTKYKNNTVHSLTMDTNRKREYHEVMKVQGLASLIIFPNSGYWTG